MSGNDMFTIVENPSSQAVIKVIGVGGGGCNAVHHMINTSNVAGVDYICINTDAQALQTIEGATVLQLGGAITRGLGAGANPEVGRQAALEDKEKLTEILNGSDMVFVTAGMGGGTGTGAAPVVAEICKELGILVVGVVTRPFTLEGKRRTNIATNGVDALYEHVDSLITIPNDRLLDTMDEDVSLLDAFAEVDNVLQGAVLGISDLIVRHGKINVDFADVQTVMKEMGSAMMGVGVAKGDNRAVVATEKAIRNPLLQDLDLSGAKGVLVNITAGVNLSLREFQEVSSIVNDFSAEDAITVVGTSIDPELEDELRVTVVATGIGERTAKPKVSVVENKRPVAPRRAAVPNDGRIDRTKHDSAMDRQRTMPKTKTEAVLDVPSFIRRQVD